MGEIKRLINRNFVVLLFIVTVINGVLFLYAQTSGSSMKLFLWEKEQRLELTERYKDSTPEDAIHNMNKSKDDKLKELFETCDDVHLEKLKNIVKDMRYTFEYFNNYHSEIESTLENAEKLKRISIFSDPDSFSYKNLLKTAKDFERVKNVNVKIENNTAVSQFTSYYYTFYLAVAVIVFLIYNIFKERENGMWDMVHGAYSGRMRLGVIRCLIIALSSLAVTFILYFTTLIESFVLYGGIESLNTPIQNIQTFGKFTYVMDKWQYLLVLFVFSWIAVFSVCMLIWAMFVIFRNRNIALVTVALFSVIEFMIYNSTAVQSVYAIFRNVNIVRLFRVNEIYGSYVNRSIAGRIVSEKLITLVVIVIFIIAAAIIAIAGTTIMRPISKRTLIARAVDKLKEGYQHLFKNMPFVVKELHKLLITGRGIVIVLVAVAGCIYFCLHGRMTYSDAVLEKENTYITKGGKDYSYINSLIEERQEDYNAALRLYDEIEREYGQEESLNEEYLSAKTTLSYYQEMLKGVNEYIEKKEYLESIKENYGITGYMVSDRPYDNIFGEQSKTRELILIMIMISATMLVMSESMLLESKTGMYSIIKPAARGRKWFEVRKVFAGIIMTSLIFLLIYGIDFFILNRFYGIHFIDAPLMSVTFMEGRGAGYSIGDWILLRAVIRYILSVAACLISMFISKVIGKRGNRAFSIIIVIIMLIVTFVMNKSGLLL